MKLHISRQPDDQATEVRRVIEAAYVAGAKTIDLSRYMQWDIFNAIQQLRERPLAWEILAWFPLASGIEIDSRLGDQIRHLESVSYRAQCEWNERIRSQLLAEMQRLAPRFPLEGAAPLVPIIRALGIDEHNRKGVDYFHGENADLFFPMFDAAIRLAAPSASHAPAQAPDVL